MAERFFDLGDGVFKGKGLSALDSSQNNRNHLIALFGGLENLPSSVMKAKRAKPDRDIDPSVVARGYTNTSPLIVSGKNKTLPKVFEVSGRGCHSGALSTFPQNVGKTILIMYSEPGGVVFDPFAGHNSRMDLCVTNGRHYIGCDLSIEFMKHNKERAATLRKQYPSTTIELHHGDSRKIPVKDAVGDFTITSPPYFDIEEYGNEPQQLGKSKTYAAFLDGLQQVMNENFRCLKPGSFAAWFVNDFRRKGKFILYHSDTIKLAEKAGFVPHDLLVVDFGPGIRDCFLNQVVEQRILPKRHEYGLIFRKP